MRQRAVEERRLGQHRDGGGAAVGIGARDPHRVVVGGQHAARRRAALALGDDVEPVGPGAAAASKSGPRGAAAAARRSSAGQRLALPARRRDAPRRGDDRRQQIGTGAHARHLRAATAAPSPRAWRRAAPRSMAAAAWRMPSRTDVGAPGHEQRRAGVQQHDVARRPRPCRRAPTRMMAALVAASPPLSAAGAAFARPKSAGWT